MDRCDLLVSDSWLHDSKMTFKVTQKSLSSNYFIQHEFSYSSRNPTNIFTLSLTRTHSSCTYNFFLTALFTSFSFILVTKRHSPWKQVSSFNSFSFSTSCSAYRLFGTTLSTRHQHINRTQNNITAIINGTTVKITTGR